MSSTPPSPLAMYNQKPEKWRKILYGQQNFPDNYSGPQFLKELKTNERVRIYRYWEAVEGVTVLNNQISCITGFLMIFHMMYSQNVSPTYILLPTTPITALGYALYRGNRLNMSKLINDSKTLITVLLFGFIFSPLLHTLTTTISTDTIFTMTFFVMLGNLVFFDYGLDVAIVSKAISLNAAIFGAICLASRLATSYHAFVLLVEAAVFFVLYPIACRRHWRPMYLGPVVLLCLYGLWQISIKVFLLYLSIIFCINFVFTGIFIIFQKYKFNIHGPWDEAIVEENTDKNIEEKL